MILPERGVTSSASECSFTFKRRTPFGKPSIPLTVPHIFFDQLLAQMKT